MTMTLASEVASAACIAIAGRHALRRQQQRQRGDQHQPAADAQQAGEQAGDARPAPGTAAIQSASGKPARRITSFR